MKIYKGNHPGEPWGRVGVARAEDGEWAVYEKRQAHTDEWRTYKIAAVRRAPEKANYWYTRNVRTGQIGMTRDLAIMRDKRPNLHQQVEVMVMIAGYEP